LPLTSRLPIDNIVSTAKFGDLIEFSYPLGYSHWAIYDDDGHVIHFAVAATNDNLCGDLLLGETKIRRVPVGEVNVPHGAHALVSNNRHAFTPSAPEDMRLRRDALLNQSLPYNLFTLNCEHFATFIRYGKAVCNQVMPSLEKTSDYHLRCGNTLAAGINCFQQRSCREPSGG
uniref:Si:ch211-229n2.6 n=1 Tax=Pundamilia nyererei TaxID=303518 RepID=A0A3B4GA46_9CICH